MIDGATSEMDCVKREQVLIFFYSVLVDDNILTHTCSVSNFNLRYTYIKLMYVFMHVCMYVCMCVCTYVYKYILLYMCDLIIIIYYYYYYYCHVCVC